MTNADLERALATALEPEPAKIANELETPRLWRWQLMPDEMHHWWPRPLTTDGNAMLALVEAMSRKRDGGYAARYWSGPQISYSCIFFKTSRDLDEKEGADAKTLPLAVAKAAAKALGVWKEDPADE